jgi:uncharacterized protein (TIGR00730 family)
MAGICVYCGSSTNTPEPYFAAARELGAALAAAGHRLVYGGAHVGLMGAVADAALAGGAHVTGVIPRALIRREVAHSGLSEMHEVESMHDRKALMAELSDAFIALPGGYGTLEELFEIITWKLLDFHQKPVILLNTGGYFDHLLAFLDHAATEQFIRPAHRDLFVTAATPAAALTLAAGTG